MSGSSIGKIFKCTTFGESHGNSVGVVIDGMPSNIPIKLIDLQNVVDKRAPGKLAGTTDRVESDQVEILSGLFEGKTLGTPICVMVKNLNQKSDDYDWALNEFRVGHADKTTLAKYGIRDHRGGGRSSGRETVSRVIAGFFASLIIPKISVKAFAQSIGQFKFENNNFNYMNSQISKYGLLSFDMDKKIEQYLVQLKKNGDSVGGAIVIKINNCPAGLGEPVFDKLKASFAHGLMSIGGCTSFSYGRGEDFANLKGSEAVLDLDNFGGIEGGISNGETITLKVTFKPTSTIGKKAKEGRHDPCIIPRVIPVVEAMVKIILADNFLQNKVYGN